MKEIEIIVAVAKDGAIGKNGDLIWRLTGDLQHFKQLTLGHTIIMGRRTWESLPKRPLPGRLNIVVSRQADYEAPGATVATSLADALAIADSAEGRIFVIGGGEIYAQALPATTRLHLSLVDATCEDADTRFPKVNPEEWEVVSDEAGVDNTPSYRFIELQRR